MAGMSADLRALIESAPLAHVTTLNADGDPRVTVIWIGADGDDIVSGHMARNQKVRNLAHDPRAVLSFQAPPQPGIFLAEHAVVYARTDVTEGGAWDLLDALAKRYVAPDFTFPAPKSDGGYVIRYAIERVAGVGPWVPGAGAD
jgi:PPOX class probable F420-dependent enzyme